MWWNIYIEEIVNHVRHGRIAAHTSKSNPFSNR